MLRGRKNSSSIVTEKSKPFVFPKYRAPSNPGSDWPSVDPNRREDFASLKISPNRLFELCDTDGRYLVHLVWPKNEMYFLQNLAEFPFCGVWVFKALPGHGVKAGDHSTPVINFLVLDEKFACGFEETASAKNIQHGIVLERSAIVRIAEESGNGFAVVQVRHPKSDNIFEPSEYWRYDIGRYRVGGMNKLNYATVARLATPLGEVEQLVLVPAEAIVAWW